MGNRNIIVSTLGYGHERFGEHFAKLGHTLVNMGNVNDAEIAIRDDRVLSLVIPSLTHAGLYRTGEQGIIELIKAGADLELARIVVISRLASAYTNLEKFSTDKTLIRVRSNSGGDFYFNIAQFLACKIDEI